MQFSINFKRSAHPTSRQTDSTDSMHSDILARSAKINISAVGTTLPILARWAVIFSAKRGPTQKLIIHGQFTVICVKNRSNRHLMKINIIVFNCLTNKPTRSLAPKSGRGN